MHTFNIELKDEKQLAVVFNQNASFYVIPAHAGIHSSKRTVPDVGWISCLRMTH